MVNEARNEDARTHERPSYDPPLVERVMDAEELAREVHYAGEVRPSDIFF